ncbi:MAG: hypothetical protein H0U75_10570 [Legionella sp.]|nr:hypothetical protein [Legionella sp.]
MEIVHQLLKIPSKDMIQQAAKQLGLAHKKNVVVENEQELGVLFNHILFHYVHNGIKIIERCAREVYLTKKWPQEKLQMLDTLQNASYGVLSVLETLPFGGLYVEDCLNDKVFLLMDEGLSFSAQKGLMIATSYLIFPEFAMTTGAALPVIYHVDKLDDLIDEFDINYRSFSDLNLKQQSKFATQLTKHCLHHGSLDHVGFVEH